MANALFESSKNTQRMDRNDHNISHNSHLPRNPGIATGTKGGFIAFGKTIQKLLWVSAGYGVANLTGIPLLGPIVGGLLSSAANTAADIATQIISYDTHEQAIIAYEIMAEEGAEILETTQYDDGSIEIEYDVSAFTGEIITTETLEALSENWF